MSEATDRMNLIRKNQCYSRSKYKAAYKKKYGKDPDRYVLMKWETRCREKKQYVQRNVSADTFEGRLQLLMAESYLNCRYLAAAIFKCDSAIEKWCRGEQKPNFYDLDSLSELFGVTTDYLIKGAE